MSDYTGKPNPVSVKDVLIDLWNAGFRGADWLHMAAITGAESGYDANALDVSKYGKARGLFQILDRAHPDVPDSVAYDPQASAKVAYTLYSQRKAAGGTGFEDWAQTVQSGAWQKFAFNVALTAQGLDTNKMVASAGAGDPIAWAQAHNPVSGVMNSIGSGISSGLKSVGVAVLPYAIIILGLGLSMIFFVKELSS